MRTKCGASKGLTGDEGEDVVKFNAKNKPKQDGSIDLTAPHETQMARPESAEHKAQVGEGDSS